MKNNPLNRPNKQAIGFTKHYEMRQNMGKIMISNPNHPDYNNEKTRTILGLIVKGTNDVLSRKSLWTKKIKIEHPIDKGYFKEVIVLSDIGKRVYKRKKQEGSNITINNWTSVRLY